MAVPERPVLVAPDSFKGTFRASEVAGAIGRGLERAGLVPPDLCPVADGGEGTLDALLPQLGGELVAAQVRDPLGRPVTAGFGLVERHVYARVPARVGYELSPAGEQLLAALAPLAGWGAEHRADVLASREHFDRVRAMRSNREAAQTRTRAGTQLMI